MSRVSAPSGADQVVLPDHLGERRRAQPVGQRARRALLQSGGFEEVRHGER